MNSFLNLGLDFVAVSANGCAKDNQNAPLKEAVDYKESMGAEVVVPVR